MLDEAFKVKIFYGLTYFFRLEIAKTNRRIHLCQQKYTLDLLKDTDMLGSAPFLAPINFSNHISSTMANLFLILLFSEDLLED